MSQALQGSLPFQPQPGHCCNQRGVSSRLLCESGEGCKGQGAKCRGLGVPSYATPLLQTLAAPQGDPMRGLSVPTWFEFPIAAKLSRTGSSRGCSGRMFLFLDNIHRWQELMA